MQRLIKGAADRAGSLSAPETDKPVVYDTMPGALRSAAAQLYRFQGRPEWLFLFSDLVSSTMLSLLDGGLSTQHF